MGINHYGYIRIFLASAIAIVLFTNVKFARANLIIDPERSGEYHDSKKLQLSPLLTTFPSSIMQSSSAPLPQEILDDYQFKVVCYLSHTEWDTNKISEDLCPYIIYQYQPALKGYTFLSEPMGIPSDLRDRVLILKRKGIKVLIPIGGYDEPWLGKYEYLSKNATARVKFASEIVIFLENNGFDGVEWQWGYPTCWKDTCYAGPETDKTFFTNLIKDLHKAFKPKNLLISAYVSPTGNDIDYGYDVPAISEYLDWITVKSYGYHGFWNRITGHIAPLYPQPNDRDMYDYQMTINFTINHWIDKGAEKKKLLITIPMFGFTYTLNHRDKHGLGAESDQPGLGELVMPYSKICQNILDNGWTMVRDTQFRIGPYAYLEDQWVSFDDVLMVKYKSEYIKQMGLGGAMISQLGFEDFDNVCKCESYPLLKAINRVLRNYSEPDPRCYLDFDNSLS